MQIAMLIGIFSAYDL